MIVTHDYVVFRTYIDADILMTLSSPPNLFAVALAFYEPNATDMFLFVLGSMRHVLEDIYYKPDVMLRSLLRLWLSGH